MVKEKNQNSEKSENNAFKSITVALIVVMALLLTAGVTTGILYLTNPGIKSSIDKFAVTIGIKKSEEATPTEDASSEDMRINSLADYYLSMDLDGAADKLLSIKKEDKKLYASLSNAMLATNRTKFGKISDRIIEKEEKPNALQREYEDYLKKNEETIKADSTHYASLGVKGAIVAIENKLSSTMDFQNMATVLENMQPALVARIFYHMNFTFYSELQSYLNLDFKSLVEKETDKYTEFIRKNTSYSQVYNEMEPSMAASELSNEENYSLDQVGFIMTKLDYLAGAKILNQFPNKEYTAKVLEKMKDYEDYESINPENISRITSDSLKVLQKYDEDVDILRKAYEKMPAADLAEIVDRNTGTRPTFKEYRIDDLRSFRITEMDMTIEVLKKSKPTVVSALLSELNNSDRAAKAAYLSKEIGIPQPE